MWPITGLQLGDNGDFLLSHQTKSARRLRMLTAQLKLLVGRHFFSRALKDFVLHRPCFPQITVTAINPTLSASKISNRAVKSSGVQTTPESARLSQPVKLHHSKLGGRGSLSGRSDGAGGGKATRNWEVTRNLGSPVVSLVGLGALGKWHTRERFVLPVISHFRIMG